LACLYGNDIGSDEIQEKILLYDARRYYFIIFYPIIFYPSDLTYRCFSSSSTTLQTTKPIAVHALSTATKNAVLPEVTTVLAQRAATTYLTTGIKMVSTQGILFQLLF
jgi:hypothetical protein